MATIAATGHDRAIAQSVRLCHGFHEGLRKLGAIALPYRAALEPLLHRWREPAEAYQRSWDALTALLVGRHLNRLAWMFGPTRNEAWGAIRDGMIRAGQEIELIDERDELWRDTLWAIGRKTYALDEWTKDETSPLGKWVRCRATLWNGTTETLLLPDSRSLAVSLRLRENPADYLEPWDIMWYVLPQLADRAPGTLPPPEVFPFTLLVAD
jgi:hypothetical protein